MKTEIKRWLHSDGFRGFNKIWYSWLGKLEFTDQILFIRKLVECHRLGILSLGAEDFYSMMQCEKSTIFSISLIPYRKRDFNGQKWDTSLTGGINISTYVIMQVLGTILKCDRLPYIMELYRSVANIYQTSSDPRKFDAMFEQLSTTSLLNRCGLNRQTLTFRRKYPYNEGEPIKWDVLVTIYNDKKTVLKFSEKLSATNYKQVIFNNNSIVRNGFSGNDLIVPSELYSQVIDFLFSQFNLSFDKRLDIAIRLRNESSIAGNEKLYYLSNRKPNGLNFCEGHDADEPHKLFCKPFKWCGGYACFNCNGILLSREGDYKNYTIYDLIEILKPGRFSKSDILSWYSSVNNFYIQIPHMHCRECEEMMEPVAWDKVSRSWNTAYDARYITRFRCNNPGCSQKEVIYINHCFVSQCNNVIDSRDTKECPNGFYICNQCGVCCAEEQFRLKRAAGLLSNYLKFLIDTHKMHLDGKNTPTFFCPKCGSKLIDKYLERDIEIKKGNTSIKLSKYLQCPNHEDYYGVFPRTDYKDENKVLSDFIKQQNNGDNLMVDDLPM